MSTSYATRSTVVHNSETFVIHTISHPSHPQTKLLLYEYGAHITSWIVGGIDILYCSEQAIYQVGKGIRG